MTRSAPGVLLAAVLACASMQAAAADPCDGRSIVDPRDALADVRAAFVATVRPDPAKALQFACREDRLARSDAERLQARVDVGHALVTASREPEAVALLDAAIAGAERRPSLPLAAAYLRRGNARSALREMKVANQDYAQAKAMLVAVGAQDHVLYAETLIGLTSVLHGDLDLDGADRTIDEADAVLVRLGLARSRVAADVLNQRTMIAYGRQDFAATLRYAEAEIAMIRAIGGPDDRDQLDALATVGAIKSMTRDFEGAESAQREGLRLAAATNSASLDARLGIVQNFATFYLDRQQPGPALPLAEEALALSRAHYGPGSIALFRAYLTLGAVHADLLRYADARVDYAQAAELEAVHGDAITVLSRLRFHFRKAQLDLKLGDLAEARAGIARGVALMGDRTGLGYWRGWSARLSCHLDAIDRDWTAADADCASAIVHLGEALDARHPLLFEALAGRCLAQTSGRLPGDACDAVDARLQQAGALDPKVRMLALEALAAREVARGRAESAFDLRLRTLAVAEALAAPDPLWAAQYAVAQSLAARGDRRLAIFFAKRSVEAIEAMRTRLDADRERLERGFLSDKLAVYRHAADWLLAEGRAPEAIDVLRLLKREELYDFGERAGTDERGRVSFSPHEERLMRTLDDAQSSDAVRVESSAEIERLTRLRDARRITPDESRQLETLQAVVDAQEATQLARYRRFVAGQKTLATTTTTTTTTANEDAPASRSVRSTPLATDEADAYLFVNASRVNLVFVWRGGIVRRVVEAGPDRLARALGDTLSDLSARRTVAAKDAVAGQASALYAIVGAPLDREARPRGIRRINLWLDGMLRYVPFAALWDGRGYLIERYEFAYLIDGATGAGREAGIRERPLVAFGVTRAVGGQPALPGVGDELCGIVDGPVSGLDRDDASCGANGVGRGSLAGAAWANDFFTESRLQEATAGATATSTGLLHLGTHFSLRPGNMRRSWLLLGDGSQMPLATFRQLDFAGIDLVTLSACETAMAGAVGDDGREIEGLPALVHRRGAKAVVASLWRIDDRSASTLMQRFYAGLKRPRARVSEALREAQLSLLREADGTRMRPYYWAAFVPSTTAP